MGYKVVESAHSPGEWRVEALHEDADREGSGVIFYGPGARTRAEEYAAWKSSKPSSQDRGNGSDQPSQVPGSAGPRLGSVSPAAHKRFEELYFRWRKETRQVSSVARMATHPAYQEMIEMGEAAVPLMLATLQKKPDHLFFALHKITGANPVPEASEGKMKEMAEAWINWGKEKGYIE